MNEGICTKRQKWQSMNYEICTFCTKRQKYELLDLHFLHQVAKVGKV